MINAEIVSHPCSTSLKRYAMYNDTCKKFERNSMFNEAHSASNRFLLFSHLRNTIMIDSSFINRDFSDEGQFSLQILNQNKIENYIYSLDVLLEYLSKECQLSHNIIQRLHAQMNSTGHLIENGILQDIQQWTHLTDQMFHCETKIAIETVNNKKSLFDSESLADLHEEAYYIISYNIDQFGINLISDFQVIERINKDSIHSVLAAIKNEIIWFHSAKKSLPKDLDSCEVVFNSYSSGLFFHEFLGHFLETDHFYRSPLNRGKIWKFSRKLTIFENYRTLESFDDNGDPITKNIPLIRNGEILHLLSSRSDQQHSHNTGNGRRENLKMPVFTRMRSMFVQPGRTSEENHIKTINKGIYIHKIGMGEVNIFTGDFSVEVSQASLIESGKFTAPLEPFHLYLDIRHFFDKEIVFCSNSNEYHSLCGKKGATVKVKYISPSIIIKGLGNAIH
ncbi:hypothetical protein CON65_03715 [Bacillus pseudomycoides]|uniref:Metalloprotease TldD/E C-terminal domain-containing protein n=2 Tax=Bacillaceae TaxID=186817 RepID=A0AA91ZUT5_9BACI|nr:hypothetical protein COO03_05565 [Bacillus sp. AFS098217]PED83994.1 hypothetical protein CON65_03715 [Bacillus pseudomycoides]